VRCEFSAMGAKRKAQSPAKSPGKSPGKKAKVQVSPEDEALATLVQAFDGELGNHVPPTVVSMVKAVAGECLMTLAEDRPALEQKFALVVGEALKVATLGLSDSLAAANAELASQVAQVETLEQALTGANTSKESADTSLQLAGEALEAAQASLAEAEQALVDHEKEEKGLEPKKAKMEVEKVTLNEVLEIARGPEPTKKQATKLSKTLKEIGAPDALVLGVPSAVGKESALEQHFVVEACKMVAEKLGQVEAALGAFDQTVASMAEKTTVMQDTVASLATALETRTAEEAAAKQTQKAAVQAIKDATRAQKDGKKAFEKAEGSKTDADTCVANAVATSQAYEFLLTRAPPPAEEPAAEEPMEEVTA